MCIRDRDAEYELDAIIYATGFDVVSGPLTQIDIRGEGGQRFKDKWANGPRTHLGIQTAGFPNFFIAANSAFCNYTVCAEMIAEWIADCIGHLRENGIREIEARLDAQDAWVAHGNEVASRTLRYTCSSWYLGANVPGKPRVFMPYIGGMPSYMKKCATVAAAGYEGFELTPA